MHEFDDGARRKPAAGVKADCTDPRASTFPFIRRIAWLLTAAVLLGAAVTVGAAPVRVGHVEAELVSDAAAIAAGQPFTVGLHLRLDEEWHVYWRNAGDAGLAPKVTWDLPLGWTAGEIQWPYPEKFSAPPLMSYGFHDEVLLPVTITPPAALSPGESVALVGTAEWLVCKEACVPGKAEVGLDLPVAAAPEADTVWSGRFQQTQERLPIPAGDWTVTARVDDTLVLLELTPPVWYTEQVERVTFFPYEQQIIENAAEQRLSRSGESYVLAVERSHYSTEVPDSVRGILVSSGGWRGPASERAMSFAASANETGPVSAATTWSELAQALLFALLGGLILNLMPCVLPVLSLKVLGIVQQANESRRKAFGHGVVFTAGVLVSFWVLAGALALLRSGGEQLGWGFQLQSPVFVVVLASFMFLFGLNLLGVFEIGTSLTGFGGGTRRSGWSGSFFNGVTATVVATPCTAPFMGSALGFSLAQPGWVSWAVFTALGLGMAAPYLLLSASPGLLKFVPKPGRWMETLKQGMGFLLLATVVWLTWVLGLQAGINAVGVYLLGLLILAAGAWVYGRWGGLASGAKIGRRIAQAAALLLLLLGVGASLFGVQTMAAAPKVDGGTDGGIGWREFDAGEVAARRNAGEVVFIDFTAAWCLSCKVNERVAFGSEEVQKKFAELGVAPFKADWTSRNPEITRALAEYGRNSVPLYVLYAPGREPVILPEILTPGIVLDALNELNGSRN